MRPLRDIFDEVSGLENLFDAAQATLARGRRFRGEGARFKFDLESEIFKLHGLLASGRYRHGKYRLFSVWDPKVRVIAAATVRDRVVHHAVHDVVAPRLDRMFIHDSYACRLGKGTHRALDRAHHFLRGGGHALHLDVKSYFASIDHETLKGIVRRYVADERALQLLEMIIDSTAYLAGRGGAADGVTTFAPPEHEQLTLALGLDPEPGAGGRLRGLPLGNLTSQFFANLYLNELDQYVKHTLKARRYVRYMDDMLLFADDSALLGEWEGAVRAFARERLLLELHPGGGPRAARHGVGFLGFRLFPGRRRLKRRSVERFIRRMNGYAAEWRALAGAPEPRRELEGEAGQSARSFNAHALHGDTWRLRQRLYGRFPMLDAAALLAAEPRDGAGRREAAALAEADRAFQEGEIGYGDAADCGEDARREPMAAAARGEVPARPAPAAGGPADGGGPRHPGPAAGGGAGAARRGQGRGAGARQPAAGAVAPDAAPGARGALPEQGVVGLLRREPGGGGQDARRLAQEFGISIARVHAAAGSRSGDRGTWFTTRPATRPARHGGRIAAPRGGRAFTATPPRRHHASGQVGAEAEARAQDGAGYRGGNWNNAASYARASDRNNAANVNAKRNNNNGGRGGRSAPSGVAFARRGTRGAQGMRLGDFNHGTHGRGGGWHGRPARGSGGKPLPPWESEGRKLKGCAYFSFKWDV